ncbi:MAG: hypothetical protein AB2A00_04430 [Myxococcota bacterium]
MATAAAPSCRAASEDRAEARDVDASAPDLPLPSAAPATVPSSRSENAAHLKAAASRELPRVERMTLRHLFKDPSRDCPAADALPSPKDEFERKELEARAATLRRGCTEAWERKWGALKDEIVGRFSVALVAIKKREEYDFQNQSFALVAASSSSQAGLAGGDTDAGMVLAVNLECSRVVGPDATPQVIRLLTQPGQGLRSSGGDLVFTFPVASQGDVARTMAKKLDAAIRGERLFVQVLLKGTGSNDTGVTCGALGFPARGFVAEPVAFRVLEGDELPQAEWETYQEHLTDRFLAGKPPQQDVLVDWQVLGR